MKEFGDYAVAVEIEPIFDNRLNPWQRYKVTLWVEETEFGIGRFMFKRRAVWLARRKARRVVAEWDKQHQYVTLNDPHAVESDDQSWVFEPL